MTAVAHLVVNNEPARVLVDTGCEVSMASPDLTNLLFSPCPVVQVRHNEEVVNLTGRCLDFALMGHAQEGHAARGLTRSGRSR